jgi:hypothetical protein
MGQGQGRDEHTATILVFAYNLNACNTCVNLSTFVIASLPFSPLLFTNLPYWVSPGAQLDSTYPAIAGIRHLSVLPCASMCVHVLLCSSLAQNSRISL